MALANTHARGRREYVSVDQAVQELVNHNDRIMNAPFQAEQQAIRRLASVVNKAKDEGREGSAERIVNSVNDFDVVFFGGRLSQHIEVTWGGLEAFSFPGVNRALGYAKYVGSGRCKIYLNRVAILSIPVRWKSFMQAWSVTLHEMAHAVFNVRCMYINYEDQQHHAYFRTTIHAVHRHSRERFGLPAIAGWQPYKHNHFMSEYWASYHLRGLNDHNVPSTPPTADHQHASGNVRRGDRDGAATESRKKKANDGRKNHTKVDAVRHTNGALVRVRHPGDPTCPIL